MGGSKAGFYQMSPEPSAPEGLLHEQGEVYLDDFCVSQTRQVSHKLKNFLSYPEKNKDQDTRTAHGK